MNACPFFPKKLRLDLGGGEREEIEKRKKKEGERETREKKRERVKRQEKKRERKERRRCFQGRENV